MLEYHFFTGSKKCGRARTDQGSDLISFPKTRASLIGLTFLRADSRDAGPGILCHIRPAVFYEKNSGIVHFF